MSIKNNTTSLQEVLDILATKASGANTSDATATAEEIFQGKTAYTSGGKVTGTFTIASELSTQNDLIAQIRNTANNLPNAGGAAPVLQSKTVTPSTNSQTIVADNGYDGLNTVTVNAVPTQTKSATPTSAAQDIIPDDGKFLSKVTIVGDSNLIAENIKSGVSIFGVNGTHAGGSGGDSGMFDEMVEDTLVNCVNNTATKIRNHAFEGCTSLTTVNFTECSHIGQEAFISCTSLTTASFENCLSMASSAFQGCTKLATISFPVCKSVYWKAFTGCKSLTTLDLPSCTYIGGYAFQGCNKLSTLSLPLCRQIYSSTFQSCSALRTISLPSATTIGSTAFGNCTKLSTFYLAGSSVCALSGSNAFTGTGITSTAGSIYVTASLVDSYKTATNWTYFSNRIFPIE